MIVIDSEPMSMIAEFAIPLDPAAYEEKPPSTQMTLFGWDDEEGYSDEQ